MKPLHFLDNYTAIYAKFFVRRLLQDEREQATSHKRTGGWGEMDAHLISRC